jgi:hypothetical protein
MERVVPFVCASSSILISKFQSYPSTQGGVHSIIENGTSESSVF